MASASFIAEVEGQDKTDEGNLVTVRVTGVGPEDGGMMTRAKAKAVTVTGFGPRTAKTEINIDNETRTIFADKSEGLFTGELGGVRDRLKAFRKNGLFAEVRKTKELRTERVINTEQLQDTFGPLASVVSTYEYEILVTTSFALG